LRTFYEELNRALVTNFFCTLLDCLIGILFEKFPEIKSGFSAGQISYTTRYTGATEQRGSIENKQLTLEYDPLT
jgi:hypothetical protein